MAVARRCCSGREPRTQTHSYFLSAGGGVMMTVSPPGLPGAPLSPWGPGVPGAPGVPGSPFSPWGPGAPGGPAGPRGAGVGTGTTVVSFFSHALEASAISSAAATIDIRIMVLLSSSQRRKPRTCQASTSGSTAHAPNGARKRSRARVAAMTGRWLRPAGSSQRSALTPRAGDAYHDALLFRQHFAQPAAPELNPARSNGGCGHGFP